MNELNSRKNLFYDLFNYFLHKPDINTLVNFDTQEERENYSSRILQRLGIGVDQYSILNIHKIGIDVPGRYVFEELMKWDGTSEYWPNAIARIKRIAGELDHIEIFLFGLQKIFTWGKRERCDFSLPPLFYLKKLKFNSSPQTSDVDNARSLLYTCEGGYPIGIFSLYSRSSIEELGEPEQTQLFSMVAFNFYGKKGWFYTALINPVWEAIHNRVTANILNRIKILFETKFEKAIRQIEKNISN